MKCIKCGSEKAVGLVITKSPTGSKSFTFEVCMPHIIDIKRWLKGSHMLPANQKTLDVQPPTKEGNDQ